ncbi:hypothetical protein EEB11_13285 [Pseudotabrizicola sediminis]|uniref:Cytochrome C oxidase assembly protein n=1 Tax=Pseudotabrizicola sediminis TaxID=2486418 RepID=A0ABY2KJV2_9RHOB|nr:hypothetical protein [Pseudotabrizicola sediminis]TGD42702.1 hypothetical protein EEB11_13285 [Pseudotabrizicola sediminis]
MSFRPDHELHQRRLSRNVGLGVTLVAFVVLVFALTVVKVTRGDPMQAFDHTVRPELLPAQTGGTQP